MNFSTEPYLSLLHQELATTLKPKNDDNAQRIALYSFHFLTQLVTRSKCLPALQANTLRELDGMLDELNAWLRSIDSGMVITGELIEYVRIRPNYELLEPALQRTIKLLLANPGDQSKKLMLRLSAILLDLQNAFHEALLEQARSASAGEALGEPTLSATQQQSLQDYMRKKFNEPRLEIGAIKAITGGGSKRTLIVGLHKVNQLPASIVIRADQSGGVVESTVIDEYQLVETLYSEGIPIPKPYAAEPDAAIIGSPFIVVGCVEGQNPGDHLDVYNPSPKFGLGLARAMGKLHRIPAERFGDKIIGAKSPTIDCVRADIDKFEAVWRNSGRTSVALEMAYTWLKDHLHFAEGKRSLNHCDLACHNMLAKDGELTAILDWETTIIGNPTHDLSYAYVQAVQCMPWEDFLAEYASAGGIRPSTEEWDFYHLWTSAWRISYLFVAQSFFHSGLSSSVVLAYGGQHLYQRCERELHRVLHDILERY